MTLGDIAVKARALVNTNLNNYPDANLLIDINIWYQKIVTMILESQDDTDFDDMRATDYPVQTTPLIANQRDYTIPVSERMLKVKRVDISYDGTNWYRATSVDDGAIPFGMSFDNASSTDIDLDQNFIPEAPCYDVAYNSIWLYPMPYSGNMNSGAILRVEWERNVVPFTTADYTTVLTDSTVIPGFDAPFQPMLAVGAAYEFAVAKQMPQLAQLGQQLQDWEVRLRQAYGRKELDTVLFLAPAQNYGFFNGIGWGGGGIYGGN